MTEEERQVEIGRILDVYSQRERNVPAGRYLPTQPAALFMMQERLRAFLRLLRQEGLLSLENQRILEVGCGTGGWLTDFESCGVKRENIAAIELNPERGAVAQNRFASLRDDSGRIIFPGADIRIGDATALPWHDASFDLVLQSTVFTSILDDAMRKAIAAEMMRVTRPEGFIIWYDFFTDNPWNPDVRGIRAREIRSLFAGWTVQLHRVTLAPPIARRVVPVSWTLAHLLERFNLLNTHYLGVISNPCRRGAAGKISA